MTGKIELRTWLPQSIKCLAVETHQCLLKKKKERRGENACECVCLCAHVYTHVRGAAISVH